MDIIGLLLGLLLVWSFGIACLAALPRRSAHVDEPGGGAWIVGAGGLAGLFLATLWLRALSLAGIAFGAAAIALPLLAATLALGAWILRRDRQAIARCVRQPGAQCAGGNGRRRFPGAR